MAGMIFVCGLCVEHVRMKLITAFVFLALAVPASAHPHPLRWIAAHKLQVAADALMIGASALDVASTRAAIDNGGYEANPLYGARPGLSRLLAVKAAVDLTVAVGNGFLDRHTRGQSRWKRLEMFIPAFVVSVPQIWAAHHNWTSSAAQ